MLANQHVLINPDKVDSISTYTIHSKQFSRDWILRIHKTAGRQKQLHQSRLAASVRAQEGSEVAEGDVEN